MLFVQVYVEDIVIIGSTGDEVDVSANGLFKAIWGGEGVGN